MRQGLLNRSPIAEEIIIRLKKQTTEWGKHPCQLYTRQGIDKYDKKLKNETPVKSNDPINT